MIPPVNKDEAMYDDEGRSELYVRPEWIKWYYGRWAAATQMMDPEQKGWYMNLLMYSAMQGDPPGYLIDDEDELTYLAGIKEIDAIALRKSQRWARVRAKFRKSRDYPGLLYNKMLVETINKASSKAKFARKSANQRWANREGSKEIDATALHSHSRRNATAYADLYKERDKEKKYVKNTYAKIRHVQEPESPELVSVPIFPEYPPVESTKNPRVVSRLADEVFEFWKQEHPAARFGLDRKRKVEARLKEGYSVEQLKMAILGNRESPHHRGENNEGTKYQDLELICRSSSKVEQFIELHQQFLNGGNGSGNTNRLKPWEASQRPQQKPWESSSERNARLERANKEWTESLRVDAERTDSENPPPLSLTTDGN